MTFRASSRRQEVQPLRVRHRPGLHPVERALRHQPGPAGGVEELLAVLDQPGDVGRGVLLAEGRRPPVRRRRGDAVQGGVGPEVGGQLAGRLLQVGPGPRLGVGPAVDEPAEEPAEGARPRA